MCVSHKWIAALPASTDLLVCVDVNVVYNHKAEHHRGPDSRASSNRFHVSSVLSSLVGDPEARGGEKQERPAERKKSSNNGCVLVWLFLDNTNKQVCSLDE